MYNGNPKKFTNVKVYVGDKYSSPANAEIKNLYAFSSGKGKWINNLIIILVLIKNHRTQNILPIWMEILFSYQSLLQIFW